MKMNDASQRQVEAADPTRSTWLAANAGSGKTHVLTDRVARLLLEGVMPQNILCLTYTKAAASEMQNRLFQRLGRWTMLENDTLLSELQELGIEHSINVEDVSRARTLFARAIEAPGGLKIQTIHSFCASILRRFPLEAGVSPQFIEIDERAQKILLGEVLEVISDRTGSSSFDGIAHHFTGAEVHDVMRSILNLSKLFKANTTREDIWKGLGLRAGYQDQDLQDDCFLPGDSDLIFKLRTTLLNKTGNDLKAGKNMLAIKGPDLTVVDLPVLESVFLTKSGANPFTAKTKAFPTKDTRLGLAYLEQLEELMVRVESVRQSRVALRTAQRTEALYHFATEFLQTYHEHKQQRGFLDFDDLILRTQTLLSDESVANWVLFRLDGGVDHILVDEAQDTSPAQWDVIKLLAQEFTSGQGARADVHRTIFVVGDKKQSIFSFHGADPEGFDRMRDQFEAQLLEIKQPFQSTTLNYSFRSSPAILDLVDQVFSNREGLGSQSDHLAYKSELPGRVDIWPVFQKPQKIDTQPWTDPIDEVSADHQDKQLANALSAQIKELIETETITQLDHDGTIFHRKITAGDFLILVQNRQKLFFREVHRACKEAGLPIAGADRLKVSAELGVRDIISLLSFLALPEDNLSLAEALRSPLFGWSEREMFNLAQGRDSQFLWRSLQSREAEFPDAVSNLVELRNLADFKRPFELINHILITQGGRSRLLGQLGLEAAEGIDALVSQSLIYEQSNVPSLTGFLVWLDSDELIIKRQMDTIEDKIRVMTVHGAKGLEAPIVILPDTAARSAPTTPDVVDHFGLAVWKPNKNLVPDTLNPTLDKLKLRQINELDRLLYVALTRAESWLIVMGSGDIKEDADCWYNAIRAATVAKDAAPLITTAGIGLRYEPKPWKEGALRQIDRRKRNNYQVPDWVKPTTSTTPPTKSPRAPSDLGGDKVVSGSLTLANPDAQRLGTAIHLLLETLPNTPQEKWKIVAEKILDADVFLFTWTEAKEILYHPDLAHIFAPGTFGEVNISAHIGELNGDPIQGSIDRLIISTDTVLAIDFKTNQLVPKTPNQVPEGILRQLGAYAAALQQIFPDHQVETAVLWTKTRSLMKLPNHLVITSLEGTSPS
ncbi:MAG: double-strand break repair helicase AddA [Planktomarina sp.]|nr:double-strand break repair helicase AddA [Planktomarina sp.]